MSDTNRFSATRAGKSMWQCLFGRVASHGVSLLPVSDTEEFSVRATAVPSNTKKRVGE